MVQIPGLVKCDESCLLLDLIVPNLLNLEPYTKPNHSLQVLHREVASQTEQGILESMASKQLLVLVQIELEPEFVGLK